MKLAEYQVRKLTEQLDQLRAALAAMTARAEAAEAKLAAVPEAAIMRTLFTRYRSGEQYTADADAINEWAAQQSEV